MKWTIRSMYLGSIWEHTSNIDGSVSVMIFAQVDKGIGKFVDLESANRGWNKSFDINTDSITEFEKFTKRENLKKIANNLSNLLTPAIKVLYANK